MIRNRTNFRWAAWTGAASAAALSAYIAYASLAPNGARGGSAIGLSFAVLAALIFIFEFLLGLRKRYPASPFGAVKTWLKAHIWLGSLSLLLVLLHSGFHWGHGLAALLMWVYAVVMASGALGVALQIYIPARMTELVTWEVTYEQIPTVIRGLRMEADERIEFITADLKVDEEMSEFHAGGGVKVYFDAMQKQSAHEKMQAAVAQRKGSPQIRVPDAERSALRSHYLQEIRPFLTETPPAHVKKLLGRRESLAAYFNHLRTVMPVVTHMVLNDVESICDERRQFLVQRRYHLFLHTWLLAHVPLSAALLILTGIHAVISLLY